MKVLVTGASGSIGGAVVRALRRRGHDVLALVTSPEGTRPLERPGVRVEVGDLRSPDTARCLVPGVDGVVHAAQLRTPAGPSSVEKESAVHAADRRMVDALVGACLSLPAPPLLVYTSGVWSYGDHGERWIDEDTPETPPVASRGHCEVARHLLELHRTRDLPVVILLPGVLYGPVASFEQGLYRPIVEGALPVVGDGRGFWSSVHADDLGDGYALALERPRPGERFNLVDDEPVRARALFDRVARCAAREPPASMSHDEARKSLGAPLVECLTLSVRARNAKARRELGWEPRYVSVHEGMPRAVEALESARARPGRPAAAPVAVEAST